MGNSERVNWKDKFVPGNILKKSTRKMKKYWKSLGNLKVRKSGNHVSCMHMYVELSRLPNFDRGLSDISRRHESGLLDITFTFIIQ